MVHPCYSARQNFFHFVKFSFILFIHLSVDKCLGYFRLCKGSVSRSEALYSSSRWVIAFALTVARVELLLQKLHCPQSIKYLLSLQKKFAHPQSCHIWYYTTSLSIPCPPLLETLSLLSLLSSGALFLAPSNFSGALHFSLLYWREHVTL